MCVYVSSFAASGDVQRHIVIHSGARPHLCDICGRGAHTHTNTHTIELMHNSDTQYFLLNVLLASYFDYQGGVSNIIAFKIS